MDRDGASEELSPKNRRVTRWYWLFIGIITALGIITILVLLFGQKPPIPGAIKKQVTAVILVPKGNGYTVDRESAKFDASLKLLTFNVKQGTVTIVISEQPTPESFTDIPQVYDKVVTSMNEYTKFDTEVGTVHLTRPKELGGKQAAVINTKGTLIFVKPESDLTDDQWRKFFNSFVVVK